MTSDYFHIAINKERRGEEIAALREEKPADIPWGKWLDMLRRKANAYDQLREESNGEVL